MKVLCLVTAWPRYVERAQYLERALASLREHAQTGGLDVDWCVATETHGCDADAEEIQRRATAAHDFELLPHDAAPSLGSNLTSALSGDRSWEVLLYTQEDWLATAAVPLADAVRLLAENPDIAVVRLLLSGHPHELRDLSGEDRWLEMLPGSEWFFSHNPYVARREFVEQMIPFPNREGHANGKAKELVREHGWRFAALNKPYPFRHIGEVPAMTEKHAARHAAREATP